MQMQISDLLSKIKTLHSKDVECLELSSDELTDLKIRYRPDLLVWAKGLAQNSKKHSIRVLAENLLLGGEGGINILSASVTLEGCRVTEILPAVAIDKTLFEEPSQEDSVGLAMAIVPLVHPWLNKVAQAMKAVGFEIEEGSLKYPPKELVDSVSMGRATVH